MQHEILLGLTTTPGSNWHKKVEEMKKFGINRIALFPTFLQIGERKELYSLLEAFENLEIPHVHLRGEDMEQWEFELFESKYGTQVFNIHEEDHDVDKLKLLRGKIYVENRYKYLSREVLAKFSGLCVDFAHMEDGRRRKKSTLDPIWNLIDSQEIGCVHVSAIKTNVYNPYYVLCGFDRHKYRALSEFDYMKKYRHYLPRYISLELENSFQQQLKVKKYLEKILDL